MLSSIPLPPALPLDKTFYQMCIELSEIASAGWKMELLPARSFDAFPDTNITLQFRRAVVAEGERNTPFSFSLNKYALALEMPRAVHRFHASLFPPAPPRQNDHPTTQA